MGKKIYVGNLNYQTSSEELKTLFAVYGNVASAEVLKDRETGRSKGFGFVEMSTDQEAQAAIAGLHGKDMGGRPVEAPDFRLRGFPIGLVEGAETPFDAIGVVAARVHP